MNYTDTVATLANLLVMDSVLNVEFQQILPSMLEYSSNRIQNDLDLIASVSTATAAMVAGTRQVTIPDDAGSLQINIINSVNLITPAATLPDAGTRNALQRVSVEALNYMWPSGLTPDRGQPVNYAVLNDQIALFGPFPDAAYKAEFVGVVRLAPISVSNTTTWITDNLPELFIAASMVYGTGWQRDFGAQTSDPQAGMSWEQTYQNLLQSAGVQEFRKFSRSSAWQPVSPSPLANPPRQ